MLTASDSTAFHLGSARHLAPSLTSDGTVNAHFSACPIDPRFPDAEAQPSSCREPFNVSGQNSSSSVLPELDSEPLMIYPGAAPACWELLPEGSVKTSVFHMTNATLGAGIVCLPYAYLNLGLILGILTTILFALLSLTSTKFLVHSLNASRTMSFEAMALRAGGPFLAFLVQLVIVIFNFGAAVGYLICVGDVFDVLIYAYGIQERIPSSLDWIVQRQVFLTLVVVFFLVPASAVNSLSSLRLASFLGLLALELLVVATLILAVQQGKSPDIVFIGAPGLFPPSAATALRGLPLLVFAFSCQSNAPAIYHELQGPTYRRMAKVANRAVAMSFVTYIVMGTAGFVLFGGGALPNILENFTKQLRESLLLLIAFCGIMTGLLLSYPMNLVPCRHSVELFFFPNGDAPTSSKLFISVALVLTSLVLSLLFPSVAVLFSLMGSTCGAGIAMIFPGIFYLKLVTAESLTAEKTLDVRKGWLLIGTGVLTAVIGTVVSIQELTTLPKS